MVNVITKLEQRNRQLLEEINNINKKREEEIEDLKLKIWSLSKPEEENSYIPGQWWYKQLSKKWLEEGKLRIEGENVHFDNISAEEMLENFCEKSKELASTCSEYISSWSRRGYQYEKKIDELNKYKEQVKDLAGEVRELLFGYSELSEEDIEKERIYWQVGEPEELLEKIGGD